jgi:S-formylglutathione hydrolase
VETVSETRCFGGVQGVYRHAAKSTGCDMEFAVYLPPQAQSGPVPVLTWLSGLTCTWENFVVKAGAQRYAAEHGVALVAPDTSPRGLDLPGEHDDWDFGSGAGFYVDATRAPWSAHYRMYSYVVEELPALVVALRNPERYRSLSAFAPISHPMHCPWGEKALGHYLGSDREAWRRYDTCELLAESDWRRPILVDQGEADGFLAVQLKPERLREACASAGVPLELRLQPGYDHSYYFIASFIGDHVAHHARALRA